jgi:hypothetical protein
MTHSVPAGQSLISRATVAEEACEKAVVVREFGNGIEA